MRNLRKIMIFVLVTAVVFQGFALKLFAETAKAEPLVSGNVIRFDLTPEALDGLDAATSFPNEIFLQEYAVENPMKQPAPVQRTQYTEIPGYFQQFYGAALYGEGTVATCGSSITALSMVASYLTGYDYLPDELARWFAAKAEDDVARLTHASQALGLPFETSDNWEYVFEQLQQGKCVVVQTDEASVFSDSWHFVVLKSVTEDGKILINDPSADNLIREDLKEKYVVGFDPADISIGFRFAWIYDKSQIPADIGRYNSVLPVSEMDRYGALALTPAEKQLLARVVYVKANGECEEGQQMLVEVILNRLLSEEYPDALKEIVYGEEGLCKADELNAAELTQLHYSVVERVLQGQYLLEENVTDFWYECHK